MRYFFASKSQQASKIIQHFPPHRLYIEPFCGTAIVGMYNILQNKPKMAIFNDIDEAAIKRLRGLFKINAKELIENYPVRFGSAILHTSRYSSYLSSNEKEILNKATAIITKLLNSLPAKHDYDYIYRYPRLSSLNHLLKLYRLYQRAYKMAKIEIYNEDALQLLQEYKKQWDKSDTLIYLDPPYQNLEQNYSVASKVFKPLLEIVKNYKNAKIYLSHNTPVDGFEIIEAFEVRAYKKRQANKLRQTPKRVDYLLLKV